MEGFSRCDAHEHSCCGTIRLLARPIRRWLEMGSGGCLCAGNVPYLDSVEPIVEFDLRNHNGANICCRFAPLRRNRLRTPYFCWLLPCGTYWDIRCGRDFGKNRRPSSANLVQRRPDGTN